MKTINYLVLGMILTSCSGQSHMKQRLMYPCMISPIYYLDTFQINNPRVVVIDSILYITSQSVLNDSLGKNELLKKKGVETYLTQRLTMYKNIDYTKIYGKTKKRSFCGLQSENEFVYIEDNLELIDSIRDVPIYRFNIEPQNFLLTLITKKDSVLAVHDVIYGIEYSNDYMIAIAPIFKKKDRKTLEKNEYRRLLGKDPDWKYYLPDWVYNLLF